MPIFLDVPSSSDVLAVDARVELAVLADSSIEVGAAEDTVIIVPR